MTIINNPKQKRRLAAVYIIMALAFVAVLTIAVLFLTGKNVQFKNGNVSVQATGKLKVAPIPSGVQVTVNDKSIDKPLTNDKQVNLVPGNYHIKVNKAGYLPWEKIVDLKSDQVRWVHPRLVPAIKRVETVKVYPRIVTSFASPKRRYLVNEIADNAFEIVDLRSSNTPRFQALNISMYFTTPDPKKIPKLELGNQVLKFYAWNEDKGSIFFKDVKAANGAGNVYLIDPDTPTATINVSDKYRNTSGEKIVFDDLKVADRAGNIIFVRSGAKVYRINLSRPNDPATLLFDDIKDFSVVSENVLGLLHKAPEKSDYAYRISIYNYKAGTEVEVDRIPEQYNALMQAFHYGPNEDEDYLAYTSGNRLRIIKADFNKLANPDPEAVTDKTPAQPRADQDHESKVLTAFKDKNSAKIIHSIYFSKTPHQLHTNSLSHKYLAVDFGRKEVSVETEKELEANIQKTTEVDKKTATTPKNYTEQGQLISALSDIYTYDLEYRYGRTFEYSFISGSRPLASSNRTIKWLDENAMWENVSGAIRIKDFDGQNQRKLVQALPTFDLQLTEDDSRIYYFSKDETGRHVLRRLMMSGF